MDILVALKQEEAKWEKEVNAAQQQLDTVRAAMKLLSGMNGSGKATASSSAKTTGSSSGKTNGGGKRGKSAPSRAEMGEAEKERLVKTADGEFRSRRAFVLCISGRHGEFRKVVDAGGQEESASDNSPDEERNVDDVLHVIALLALVNCALAAMLQFTAPGERDTGKSKI